MRVTEIQVAEIRSTLTSGPKLYLQLDNASDNKSRYIIGMMGWLVEHNYVDQVEIVFLMVGHTHEGSTLQHQPHKPSPSFLPLLHTRTLAHLSYLHICIPAHLSYLHTCTLAYSHTCILACLAHLHTCHTCTLVILAHLHTCTLVLSTCLSPPPLISSCSLTCHA